MGTTESIFYDDEQEKHGYRHQQQQQPNQEAYYPDAASPQHAKKPPAPHLPTPTARRRSGVDSHGQSPRPTSTSSRRTSAQSGLSSQPQYQASLQLHGTVLGMSGSGKQALLQRLEGKEPDFTKRRRDSEIESNRSRASSQDEELLIATAPYQVPSNVVTWDAKIWIEVAAQRKISKRSGGSGSDFYVILIDPRNKHNKLEKYLNKTIRSILRMQGYGEDCAEQQVRPFCLCILRNFRDKLNEDDDDDSKFVSESDLTTWTMQVLEDYPDLDPNSMVLQCEDVSLLNCYGLGQLHFFIYQAYVLRKRYDLERQLQQVVEAQSEARHQAPPAVSYQEYCHEIDQLVHGPDATSRRRDDETATTVTSSSGPGRRQIVMVPHQQGRRRTSSGESSSTLPSTQQSLVSPKDALEAFLESDSENESVRIKQSSISDNEEDEGFFLDGSYDRREDGQPHETASVIKEVSQRAKSENGLNNDGKKESSHADVETLQKQSNNDDSPRPGSAKGEGGRQSPAKTKPGISDDNSSSSNTRKIAIENESSVNGKASDAVDDEHNQNRELESETESMRSKEVAKIKNSTKSGHSGHAMDGLRSRTGDESGVSEGGEKDQIRRSNHCRAPVDSKTDTDALSNRSHTMERRADQTKKQAATVLEDDNDEDESDSEFFIGETDEHDDLDTSAQKNSPVSGTQNNNDEPKNEQVSSANPLDDKDDSKISAEAEESQQDNGDGSGIDKAKGSPNIRAQSRDDEADDSVTKLSSAERMNHNLVSGSKEITTTDDLKDTEVHPNVSDQAKGGKDNTSSAVESNHSHIREAQGSATPVVISSPDAAVSSPATSQLSAAALAALAAAEQDFEQMFQNKEQRPKKSKKKKDEAEKRKKKKDKKAQ